MLILGSWESGAPFRMPPRALELPLLAAIRRTAAAASDVPPSLCPLPSSSSAPPVVELLLRGLNERHVLQLEGLLALVGCTREMHGLQPVVQLN